MTSSAHAAIGADLDYAPQAQLGTSADGDRETDVLVIGSGPAGAAAALALATLGVHHMVITKHRWTANTPPAHITNQRTIEIFRDLGIEADVLARGTPHALMGDTVFCTSLAGDELGRVRTWGTHPAREADYVWPAPRRTATSRRRCSSRSSSGTPLRAAAGSDSTPNTSGWPRTPMASRSGSATG